ncbi:LysM peptidoglycan-binding domain-containing protein [Alteribacter aurantiacus]|uniref:LysM peptidoglycan-binding domain-containing protein n=1 Tax=Alteribacter aurantiacus TaxID=254410 RepID=UPI00042749D8|nr:LysM peptidoglycan-binding domain-containing protein [Alteribacter aurantiacus]
MKKQMVSLALAGVMVFGGGHAITSASVTVGSGDTLWRIANSNGLTVDELMALNSLSSTTIHVGQTLKVTEGQGDSGGQTNKSGTYTIQSGDGLTSIARRHQTTVNHLLELNPSITNPNLIRVGQVIVVPGGNDEPTETSPAPAPAPTPSVQGESVYQVQSGDTFYRIASNHNLSQEMLRAFNRSITNVNQLQVGQAVVIPSQELVDLAKIVHLEARGEPLQGQVAVANVVLNRVSSSQFPNSVHGVLHQNNQFAPVTNGSFATAVPQNGPINAAKRALGGENHVPNALFFFNPSTSNSEFMHAREEVKTIGNHRFIK